LVGLESPFPARLLSKDQARRIAVKIAKLPESPRHFSLPKALVLNLKDGVTTGAQRPLRDKPQPSRQSRNRRLPLPYARMAWLRPSRRVYAARIRLEPHGANSTREGQMDGVKALVVLASIYYPGDGIVAKNNYQTSSGERYDQSAPKCAALQWSLGTMLHLVHGRNNIDVTINDHGPYRKGRALDCTPAVDKALHLGGLGSVRVEAYPPLPKARPVEAQLATLVGDAMDTTVQSPAELKGRVDPHLKVSERKKTGRPLARGAVMRHNPQPIRPFWQVTFP
jgi:rare lipoprotein A (peptidoglycan hydrolase)